MRLDRHEPVRRPGLLVPLLALVAALAAYPRAVAQGCMPATPQHRPDSLIFALPEPLVSVPSGEDLPDPAGGPPAEPGASGALPRDVGRAFQAPRTARQLQQLESDGWSFAASLRYYKSGDKYVGSKQDPAGKNFAVGDYPSLDLTGAYAFNPRWSLAVSLPLVDPRDTFPHADGQRHTTGPGLSVGDLRVVGSYWLFDPTRPKPGNVVVGFGFKAPTGEHDATDAFYTPDGPVEAPADLAVQPGDGGWGVILAAQGFHSLGRGVYFYGDGFYLVNPRETNGTVTATVLAVTGQPIPLSVPDYYQVRAGLGYLAWPRRGISLSLGVRLDGIPTQDLVGGSDGFRRPGYNLAVDPGVSLSWGDHTFSLSIPVAVARSQKQSVPERSLGLRLGGSMAAEAFLVSYSRRLGRRDRSHGD